MFSQEAVGLLAAGLYLLEGISITQEVMLDVFVPQKCFWLAITAISSCLQLLLPAFCITCGSLGYKILNSAAWLFIEITAISLKRSTIYCL